MSRPDWALATGPVSGVFALIADGQEGQVSLLSHCGDDWSFLAASGPPPDRGVSSFTLGHEACTSARAVHALAGVFVFWVMAIGSSCRLHATEASNTFISTPIFHLYRALRASASSFSRPQMKAIRHGRLSRITSLARRCPTTHKSEPPLRNTEPDGRSTRPRISLPSSILCPASLGNLAGAKESATYD